MGGKFRNQYDAAGKRLRERPANFVMTRPLVESRKDA